MFITREGEAAEEGGFNTRDSAKGRLLLTSYDLWRPNRSAHLHLPPRSRSYHYRGLVSDVGEYLPSGMGESAESKA